jgi:dTDP-4-dehydrorhamnose reductase
MRLLITGSNGLLGQKIAKRCINNQVEFLCISKGENRIPFLSNNNYRSADISNEKEIKRIIEEFKPTHVINSAAITNVDFCELNPELTQQVNVAAVRTMFDLCAERNIHFQQLSTDFVFDGLKGNYKEEDEVNPLSVYAQSKVDSEMVLLNSVYTNWSIVRTIIVYGTGHSLSRSNLVFWAREALKKGGELNIVNDQFRAPTWADDLAYACIEVLKRNQRGIFHISGPETYSIYDLVLKMAEFYKLDKKLIKAVSSETLNQPAKRPPITGFDLSKANALLDYKPIDFVQSLELLEKELQNLSSNC